ncbi:hypothetical protein NDU88_005354 [Pleurodeles waltl]|uniref:Uncharacterized protein n=1 Tax=Pleurodeles waltl TaxID=8319 RepID=A0AAV7X0Y7_PLEWA|nr:hypothetical protein NDU88_005354 [Pleurodeles waltl]
MAPGLQPCGALRPRLVQLSAAERRAEWCAGEGRDRQMAQGKKKKKKERRWAQGRSFRPRGLPRRRRAPMQLEVAAPMPLSCCLAATLILLQLLLRFAPGGRLPPRSTPDQLCASGGMFTPPQRPPSKARPDHAPS